MMAIQRGIMLNRSPVISIREDQPISFLSRSETEA
jgi:hypothetical protein